MGDGDELKDEYGDEMVRLLMEAHGYTAKEAEESLAGGEGDGEGGAVVVVVEHGEQRVMPSSQGCNRMRSCWCSRGSSDEAMVADSMSEGLAYVSSARQRRDTERGRLRRWKRRCGGTARMTV